MMNYGYDMNGRPIKETRKQHCPLCGEQTCMSLSDGSVFSSSCGCNGLTELVNDKTEYTITLEGEFGNSKVLYVKGYEEAKEKYDRIISRGHSMTVVTLSQVIASNIWWK